MNSTLLASLPMHGVVVKFKEGAYWSRPYTYKSIVPYAVGDIVVVPTNDFYSVAKVITCSKDTPFDPKINYKEVTSKVIL